MRRSVKAPYTGRRTLTDYPPPDVKTNNIIKTQQGIYTNIHAI